MFCKLVAAVMLSITVFSASALADNGVQVYAGQPGPYEVHQYWHRSDSFDRRPYFATNPPVYYGSQRFGRSYGWTPYPYPGILHQEPLEPIPSREEGKSGSGKTRNSSGRYANRK
jgi:hypothetical protein